MSDHSVTDPDRPGRDAAESAVPEVLEWLIGALLALVGLGTTLGGSAVLWASDDELIAEAIAEGVREGSVESDVLTPGELTAVATETAFWLGVGLAVTGLAMVAVGILYVVGRRRTRRSPDTGNPREVLFAHAVLGAVATGVLSFVPASPILGGGVAGYVHRKRGGPTKAGAVSGLLAALPLVGILVFLAIGLLSGFGAAGVGGLGVVLGIAMVIAILAALIYFVGLGALGGFLGDAIAGDDDGTGDDPTGSTGYDSGGSTAPVHDEKPTDTVDRSAANTADRSATDTTDRSSTETVDDDRRA